MLKIIRNNSGPNTCKYLVHFHLIRHKDVSSFSFFFPFCHSTFSFSFCLHSPVVLSSFSYSSSFYFFFLLRHLILLFILVVIVLNIRICCFVITVTQSEQDRSCILLLRLQRRPGDWLWVHCVLQVKDNMENSQQPVIVCTNQVLR